MRRTGIRRRARRLRSTSTLSWSWPRARAHLPNSGSCPTRFSTALSRRTPRAGPSTWMSPRGLPLRWAGPRPRSPATRQHSRQHWYVLAVRARLPPGHGWNNIPFPLQAAYADPRDNAPVVPAAGPSELEQGGGGVDDEGLQLVPGTPLRAAATVLPIHSLAAALCPDLDPPQLVMPAVPDEDAVCIRRHIARVRRILHLLLVCAVDAGAVRSRLLERSQRLRN